MLSFDSAPDVNHGRWLDWTSSDGFIRLAKEGWLADGGQKRFCEAMLDEMSGGSYVNAGSFLGSGENRIIVPAGALKHVQSGASFEIRPMIVFDCDEHGEAFDSVFLRVIAIPVGLNLNSIAWACKDPDTPFPVQPDLHEDIIVSVLTALMAVDGVHPASAAADAAYACLALDQVVARAAAWQAAAEPNAVIPMPDVAGILESAGFDSDVAAAQAEGFRCDYADPKTRLLIPFILPFNLDVAADAGILDAVMREAATMSFGLSGFIGERWFFGREIIRALRGRGYSEDQIGYIACNDCALFGLPSDRVEAAQLCADIANSAFEPESADDWNAYVTSEIGPLTDFL